MLPVVEAFSLQKVFERLEEVVVGWREVRWIWRTRQNSLAQFKQPKYWLRDVWSSVVMENWAYSVDPCRLQALQLSVYLIDLLSIFLRYNGFARIQKAIMDHTDSRSPNLTMIFFWCWFGFEKCFGTSQFSHWTSHHWLWYKIHFSSNVTIQSRNGSLLHRIREANTSREQFFYFRSAHEATLSFFTFPICFKCRL